MVRGPYPRRVWGVHNTKGAMGGCVSKSKVDKKEPDEVLLKQFSLMISIGKGAFGKVSRILF